MKLFSQIKELGSFSHSVFLVVGSALRHYLGIQTADKPEDIP